MKSLKNPGFDLYRCKRCGHYWASSANPDVLVINSFCPDCIPKVTHVLADTPFPRYELTDEDKRSHMSVIQQMRAKASRQLMADVSRLQRQFPTKPHVREARNFLRRNNDYVIRVLWYAYELPRMERESA